jgi:ribosomal protein L11 methyltransferase
MDWMQAGIFTTTEGIEPVTGSLMRLGINGFEIEDAQDFNDFLSDTTQHWDYVKRT